ncbi:MAG: hypothetical protein ACWGQW_16195, partial [bacterium]
MSLKVQKTAAIASLLASICIFRLMVLRIDNERTYAYDLQPEPDAREYFAGAVSLVKECTYQIQLSGSMFPPRYPFGYSLLMVPMLRMGLDPIEVPFSVNRILGLGILLGLFVPLWAYRQYLAAGLACLLMATLPAFVILARSPMSEISGAFFLLIGLIGIVMYVTHDLRWCGLCGTFVLGLSVCIRFLNLPLAVLILILASLLSTPASLRRRLTDAVVFLASFLIALTPLLIYQYQAFGSPFWTGYHFWTDLGKKVTLVFHPKFLSRNLVYLLKEVFQREELDTVANIYGEGSYFGPAFVILVLILVFRFRNCRIFYVFAVPCFAYLAALLFYQFQDARFFFPVMVMVVGGASLAWVSAMRAASWLGRALLLLILLCQLSMFPGRRVDPEFERYIRAKTLYKRTATDYGCSIILVTHPI